MMDREDIYAIIAIAVVLLILTLLPIRTACRREYDRRAQDTPRTGEKDAS